MTVHPLFLKMANAFPNDDTCKITHFFGGAEDLSDEETDKTCWSNKEVAALIQFVDMDNNQEKLATRNGGPSFKTDKDNLWTQFRKHINNMHIK